MTEENNKKGYRSVLKSTSLIGGASVINILISMIRTKFVAILLGPGGVGLIGMLQSTLQIFSTVCDLGINTSGVRSVAESHGRGKSVRMSQVVQSLRRTVWLSGFLGMFLILLLSPFLSKWTFGNYDYTLSFGFLSITVLLGNILVGQACVIRGTRRIADMAKIQIIGAVNTTLISVPCYYLWGQSGIVPSLILGSVATLITSWYFARRVQLAPCRVTWRRTFRVAQGLLGFGFPLMLNSLMAYGIVYFIRIILLQRFDLSGIGVYMAAFSLSGVLTNYVLNAMSADYFPRLTAVAHDVQKIKMEVDSQSEIVLLLAAPTLAATIIFAPVVIWLFYSSEFTQAISILRWSVFGVFGRVVCWPVGYVLQAQGRGVLFLCSEIFANVLHLALLWFCSGRWGLEGTGIAFALLYLVYTVYILCVYHILTGNYWSRSYVFLLSAVFAALLIVDINSMIPSHAAIQWSVNIAVLIVVCLLCARQLGKKTGITLQSIKNRIVSRFARNKENHDE